ATRPIKIQSFLFFTLCSLCLSFCRQNGNGCLDDLHRCRQQEQDADKIIVRHCLRGTSKGISGVQRCQNDHTDVHGVYEAGGLLSLFQKKQKHQNRQHSHHCHASCLQWAHRIVPLPC